ncbi:MAG: DoxX family protein [Kiritimatiellia bacterium]
MNTATLVAQWIIGLGILNVWLIRAKLATAYRGGNARNMKEEFAVYGLPVGFMYGIGVLKVGLAIALMAGTWFPQVVQPAAIAMAVLMAGAVSMHLKVKDTFKKTLPSLVMLLLSLFVAFTAG